MTHQFLSMVSCITFIDCVTLFWGLSLLALFCNYKLFSCRCFMEYQILAEFLRLLKISRNSRIEAYLLHYLSIMIQNLDSDHAICMILLFLFLFFCEVSNIAYLFVLFYCIFCMV